MALKLFFLVLVISGVFCEKYKPDVEEPQGPAKYSYKYGVADADSGNSYVHGETRDGDAIQGSYVIQLPDSRTQKVSYTVNGDSGYVADVTYEGEPRYPDVPPKKGYN
ncbi:cuticle protein 8-like [Macrobrachium rosenbergii]|uniref:cuticle protein 8-like n=1 Tax=Macrobrachium rosenbergii TaxID=79674 RepID=UPI0034D65ACA